VVVKAATILTADLAEGLILSPERYDSRRQAHADGVLLSEVAALSTTSLRPSTVTGQWRVLDTSHAEAGLVRCDRAPVPAIGSTKRVLRSGAVIVSRLRPYLRQVGLVDPGLMATGAQLCCSTEFYVLTSTDEQSIAFLVPFLLSQPVQAALAAGQEGGHHPRFPSTLLMGLRIPAARMAQRTAHSAAVEAAVAQVRAGRAVLAMLTDA
jgi:hypothetical protein